MKQGMAPMCTPEKTKESHSAANLEELYFIPHVAPNEESLDSSDFDLSEFDLSDDDEEVKEKMDKLLATFPVLDRHFNLHGQVGEGTFSTVYVAALKTGDPNQRFAVKHIVPTCHPDRIRFELKCLQEIGGEDNVAGIKLCMRNLNNVIFVMPYQRHDYFNEYVGEMDAEETRLYMYNLLVAIARVHDFNIIHRDIKPSNFLYDRFNKKFLLVDFGLAQQQPAVESSITSGSTQKRKREASPITHTPTGGAPTQVNKKARAVNLSQKENHPNNLSTSIDAETTTPATSTPPVASQSKSSKLTYIQFDLSPEMKLAAAAKIAIKDQQKCACYGKPKVCSTCMLQPQMQASRAGTPGFRPPEVLFKHAQQSTALDIWAAGIIFLSILSNTTNFFSCPNDIAALLELITLFGYDNMNKIASKFGRYFICSEKKPALDLRKVCCTIRNRGAALNALLTGDRCAKCNQFKRTCFCKNVAMDKSIIDMFPRTAYDLLTHLLDLNPNTRITARNALKHPFFKTPSSSMQPKT